MKGNHAMRFALLATLVLAAAAGCASPARTYATSAQVRALNDPGQYMAEIKVERLEAEGTRKTLYQPNLTFKEGHPASISVDSDDGKSGLKANVSVDSKSAKEARLQVEVKEDRKVVASADMTLTLRP
jgi:hypothetical protein